MKKNVFKKKNKKDLDILDIKDRQFGMILESIDSKLDLVVEGHETLDVKIDKVDAKVEDLRTEMNYKFEVVFEKFDEVDKRFEDVDKRFDEVDKRFEDVDKRFNEVDKRFDEVTDELRIIRNELKEKVGRDEFLALEKRVIILEKRLSRSKI